MVDDSFERFQSHAIGTKYNVHQSAISMHGQSAIGKVNEEKKKHHPISVNTFAIWGTSPNEHYMSLTMVGIKKKAEETSSEKDFNSFQNPGGWVSKSVLDSSSFWLCCP